MKEKLAELESLMRQVREKMDELEKTGFTVLDVIINRSDPQYEINLHNGLPEMVDELSMESATYSPAGVPGWKMIAAVHDGIGLSQFARENKPFARRGE